MNIAVIPARSGSKGVPNKNIFEIWGKSLIGWAADCAKETNLFQKIILSTDSETYAKEGLLYGCSVPYLRPSELAFDKSNINHVLIDLINKLPDSKEWETITLLEPTCPLRTPAIIKGCYKLMFGSAINSVITVSEVGVKFHPYKQFLINGDGSLGFFSDKSRQVVNRQELNKTYIRNGAAYVIRTGSFMASGNIIGDRAMPYICNDTLINIDSPQDIEDLQAYERTHALPW